MYSMELFEWGIIKSVYFECRVNKFWSDACPINTDSSD